MTPAVELATALVGLFLPIVGLIWHAATLAERVRALEVWRQAHEPTAVQLASLQATLASLQGTLAKIEEDIQRLYDRSNRRTG